MGIFSRGKSADSANYGKHAKPKASESLDAMSAEERLAKDVELVDEAYRRASLKKTVTPESTTPALDSYTESRKGGRGKHKK